MHRYLKLMVNYDITIADENQFSIGTAAAVEPEGGQLMQIQSVHGS